MPTSKLKGDVLNFWSVFTHNRVSVGCLQGRWVSRLAVCDQKAIIAVAMRPHAELSPHEGGGGETWWCGWNVAFQAATFPFDFNFNRYLKGNFKRRSIMGSIKRNWFFKYNFSKELQRKKEKKREKMQQQSFNRFMVVFVRNRRKTWPLSVCVRRRREQGGHVCKCVCREPTFIFLPLRS